MHFALHQPYLSATTHSSSTFALSITFDTHLYHIVNMGLPIKLGVPHVPKEDSTQGQPTQTNDHQNQQQTEAATGAGVNTGAGTTRSKTEAEIEADRLYEEAIEEEYARRDGGS
ncbi:hypothetical protein CDEST_11211 [Colletotrichum destructivum]|uniref:Uncharacterized protein n=1 Tax=Colletotrichum destructivum TaxID=34406 RepID=A0AAX4ISL1_9PEZI|nr:hypothetical protein CDEST_11211 [Colletotrichum destructivum]